MFKKLYTAGAALMAKASAALFGKKQAEIALQTQEHIAPLSVYFGKHNNAGPRRPAGSKLARMAREGRIGTGGVR